MSSPGYRGRQTRSAVVKANQNLALYTYRGFGVQIHYLVVYVAVGKHCVEILDTFLGIQVVTVLKSFLDCSHVHRGFDYCVVVLKKVAQE